MKQADNRSKKIRKDDKVLVIAGNYRGQTGTVLRVTDKGAVVQGLNLKKKAVKKSQAQPSGGFVEIERPITISNLMVCSKTDQPLKLKMKIKKDRQKELVHTSGGSDVVYRNVKKQKAG